VVELLKTVVAGPCGLAHWMKNAFSALLCTKKHYASKKIFKGMPAHNKFSTTIGSQDAKFPLNLNTVLQAPNFCKLHSLEAEELS
jgi:hypothetical protein